MRLLPVLLLLGCNKGPELSRELLSPFPSAELVDASGRVAIPADALPQPVEGTAVPVERLTWRDGFSVVQTSVLDVGVALDPASLPGVEAGPWTGGSVQMWDLDAGAPIPCFAEIDAYPAYETAPVLLVRPLQPMTPGHRVAVAVTTEVRTADGQALAPLDWFAAAVDGDEVEGIEAAHYAALADELAALGVGELAVAWDFPIGDGTAPMRHIAANVSIPTTWEFTRTDDAAETDLPPGAWLRIQGTFTTDDWLVDDTSFALEADGTPVLQGEVRTELYIFVPESVRDAAPGTVPVWIFGHGIFAKPDLYLGDPDDPSAVAELANRAGAILIATKWRGLTYTDLPVALSVGNDFGRIPELTDKLVQGVGNTIALSRLITEGELLEDPALMGLPDRSQLFYYGISLGGIEGAVMIANNDAIDAAVLHVGGSTWSTMLERSSHWSRFEPLVAAGVEDPRDRQILYAGSQLFWDAADPANYAPDLVGKTVLWQEAVGDEQVPNLTTELLARGVGAPIVLPSATTPEGLDTAALPVSPPAVVQLDPQVGLPDSSNRPAEVSGAHEAPRLFEGAKLQVLRFLNADDPGVIEHYCGDTVCSASNPGP